MKNYPLKSPLAWSIFILILLHFVSSIHSVKRFAYLLNRHVKYHSDLIKLRKGEIRTYDLIQTIKNTVPYSAFTHIPTNRNISNEISFYAFPQRIIDDSSLNNSCKGNSKFELIKNKENFWHVLEQCQK